MRKFLGLLGVLSVLFMAGQVHAGGWRPVLSAPDLIEGAGWDVVILDIRAPKDYAAGHIPGALNAPYGSWRGPATNPGRRLSDAQLTERLQSLGITQSDQVIVVHAGKNATDFGAAARVYWTLKSAGVVRNAVLNGGVAAWRKAGGVITADVPEIVRSDVAFTLSDRWMIDRAGVQDVLEGQRAAIMIDARPQVFWKGETKHKAAAEAGTLEGALNITHDSWFRGSRTEIVTGPQVLEIAKGAGYVAGETELVSFCNTGHWAATNWFALSELAGVEDVKLYPESMVGWTNAGGRVETGG